MNLVILSGLGLRRAIFLLAGLEIGVKLEWNGPMASWPIFYLEPTKKNPREESSAWNTLYLSAVCESSSLFRRDSYSIFFFLSFES